MRTKAALGILIIMCCVCFVPPAAAQNRHVYLIDIEHIVGIFRTSYECTQTSQTAADLNLQDVILTNCFIQKGISYEMLVQTKDMDTSLSSLYYDKCHLLGEIMQLIQDESDPGNWGLETYESCVKDAGYDPDNLRAYVARMEELRAVYSARQTNGEVDE